MNQLTNSITTILMAIVGVAILSVILSKNSNTTNVIQAGSSGFSNMLGAAEAPVSAGSSMGGGGGFNYSYPTGY